MAAKKEGAYKSGSLAYVDTFSGLIPCKVLKVVKRESYGRITRLVLDVVITAQRPAYQRKEVLTGISDYLIIPRAYVTTRQGQYKIDSSFNWKEDESND